MRAVYNEIVKNNVKREARTLSKYACKSNKGIRRNPARERISDRINIRPTFFHDTDRIMHSLAYTRYIDKTQVFFLFENDHITHRVLHVQFVSKIARVIGRCLKLNEDLIEAISLGHDLGHVPYGHDGERYLNKIYYEKTQNFFNHNAQSVRFLMELENRGRGLNLTLQVLDGILCHNGEIVERIYEPDNSKNWDKFLEEYEKCWTIKDYSKKIRPMTLEGCLVRICDVIAYIGRDIEDAIVVKLIKRKDIPAEITSVLGNTNRSIIDTLVRDIIVNSYDKPYIMLSKDKFDALKLLLDFNYKNIYMNPKKMTENAKIQTMFETLFEVYLRQLDEESQKSSIYTWHLKNMNKSYLKNNSKPRIVLDYIAGMTDDFFNNQFKEYVLPRSYGYYIKK